MVLGLRKKSNLRVRQPLQKIVIPVRDAAMRLQIERVQHLICSELNVKAVEFLAADNEGASDGNAENKLLLVKKIKANFKTLGPRYGKVMKALGNAIVAFSQQQINALEAEGRCTVNVEGQDCEVLLSDVEIATQDIPGWVVANDGSLTVALDIQLTPALVDEGVARELVNRIQNIRKEQLDVTDRITVELQSGEWDNAINTHRDYICSETLCTRLSLVPEVADGTPVELLDGQHSRIKIVKA